MNISKIHITNAQKARELYLDNLNPVEASADWHFAKREARRLVSASLRASNYLRDLSGAIQKNGGHTLVFRQMLAPPMSQDQFKLVCPVWVKGSENSCRPVPKNVADVVANTLIGRMDLGIAHWIVDSKIPSRRDILTLIRVTSTLMASQKVATSRRLRLAFEQEYAVADMLDKNGWTKLPSKLIDTRAAVPPKHFMHKTRFATDTTAPQEVDIACGLKNSYVLAMECKVTNDETNSVKRVNDVLKKAKAWKDHWGSFVMTAALLQGVIGAKDVQRLTDAGIHVFWSHNLNEFQNWLTKNMA
ncbi:XamI family restriction endonuclease [Sphingomonas aurantiaca]|uniref:XamI family restriction endonuclease n=1 Tax=Sphingomonas aurantiaca TaxID=185949 RepID=UPI003358F9F5